MPLRSLCVGLIGLIVGGFLNYLLIAAVSNRVFSWNIASQPSLIAACLFAYFVLGITLAAYALRWAHRRGWTLAATFVLGLAVSCPAYLAFVLLLTLHG